jgi:hypothetical protein
MVKKLLGGVALLLIYQVAVMGAFLWLVRQTNGKDLPGWVGIGMLVALAVLMGGPPVAFPFLAARAPRWFTALQANGSPATAEVLANDFLPDNWSYDGLDLLVDVRVRVDPGSEAAFEARMKCRLSQAKRLKPGKRVNVKYDPRTRRVVLPAGTEAVYKPVRRQKLG